MDVEVGFPSSSTVQARSKDLLVEVGPPPRQGGNPDAYGPFDMLLCALGTCTGYQVLDFLQTRRLSTVGAGLRIRAERNESTHKLENVTIEIRVPEGFPAKYHEALIRAAGSCPVKDQLGLKPDFRMVS
jgi:putative redox protein